MRNFVIDMTAINPEVEVAGIHWPTAQATSLQNIVFKMSQAQDNKQEGIFIESGSGGWMSDLVFVGGNHGATFGNQQFTTRNLTFSNCKTAIYQIWDWGWTYQGISINNCEIGIDMSGVNDKGRMVVGSVTLLDSEISNTPVGIKMARSSSPQPPAGNSLILENVKLTNVPVAVQGPGSSTVLAGPSGAGSSTIAAWGQGHSYSGGAPSTGTVFQGPIAPNTRAASLTAGASDFYERSKPQYATLPSSEFLSARSAGCAGDGVTDDSDALIDLLALAASTSKIVYLDHGYYRVTKTIYIPPGSRIVGESYPVILSSGAFFNDMANPKPVVQVGKAGGEAGAIEWSDTIVSTQGAQAGAILIEYNLAAPANSPPSAMWDVHTRIGGFAGSQQLLADCPKTPSVPITSVSQIPPQCIAAFMSMHITAPATGLYVENCWFWVADHDIEDQQVTQITIYAGRGLLIESTEGRIWLYGTGVEHHVLYEYQLVNTKDIVMGQIQTETAYYQPNPDARIPFPNVPALSDPIMDANQSGWGLRLVNSHDVLVYGAGLYSFFSNYDVQCSNEGNGETCQTRTFSVENSHVSVYNLNTVGTTKMITVDNVDVASYADNINGFIDTVALFRV